METNTTSIDISKLNRAEVLAALYNNSRQQGLGFVHMTVEQAQEELDERNAHNEGRNCYFDYLHGRVMKVHLGKDVLETRLYDRDNGRDAAYHAIKPLLDALATGSEVANG